MPAGKIYQTHQGTNPDKAIKIIVTIDKFTEAKKDVTKDK